MGSPFEGHGQASWHANSLLCEPYVRPAACYLGLKGVAVKVSFQRLYATW